MTATLRKLVPDHAEWRHYDSSRQSPDGRQPRSNGPGSKQSKSNETQRAARGFAPDCRGAIMSEEVQQ